MATPFTMLNDAKMPLFGFGTWLAKPNVVGESVKKALEMGYRHIDCAHCYGNEGEVGEAFTAVFSSGKVKREDVFITSKLWVSDFSNVKEACELTLKNLQLDYLDLYLIHLPFEVEKDVFKFPVSPQGHGVIGYKAERIEAVWKELEKLVKAGKLKAIGVSNFTTEKIKNLLKCPLEVKPACNQVELHPYCPQHGLLEYCEKEGITMVAFGPLGNPGNPDHVKGEDFPDLLTDPVVKSIADKHKATTAQVLIAYNIARNCGVLAKSVNENRIKENLESLNVKLDTDDMVALRDIKKRFRFCAQTWGLLAGQVEEDLWDGEMNG